MDVRHLQLAPATVRLLPEVHARRFRALVLKSDSQGLTVGMSDPTFPCRALGLNGGARIPAL